MHILQVSPYVIHPPSTGGDHRTHGIVKEFPRRGVKVTRYCQGGSPDVYRKRDFRQYIEITPNYVEHRHFNPIHDLVMAPVLLNYPNVLADFGLQLAPGPLPHLLESADVVLVREPWQFPTVLRRTNSPVVYSSHNVEIERFKKNMPQHWSNSAYDRLVELERIAIEESDAVVCTSERDANLYRQKFNASGPMIIVPNGTYESNIRPHYPDSREAHTLRRKYGIDASATVGLFMGSDYGPNVEAAESVLRFAERLRTEQFHFIIMGGVGNSIDTSPCNVTVTGYVEEFDTHFDLANVALNPMSSGGGTNIKLLDYFARSVPVISTPFGARGIDAKEGQEILIRELEKFPNALKNLRQNDELRKQIGVRGRNLTENRYTWELSSRHLLEKLQELF